MVDWIMKTKLMENILQKCKNSTENPDIKMKGFLLLSHLASFALVPIIFTSIFLISGREFEPFELFVVITFISYTLILSPIILMKFGYNIAFDVGMSILLFIPYLFGQSRENCLHIWVFISKLPLTIIGFGNLEKKTWIFLGLSVALLFAQFRSIKQMINVQPLVIDDEYFFFWMIMDLPNYFAALLVAYQITKHRTNIMKDLRVKNKKIMRISKAKEHFFGCVSHELRNPLNVLQNTLYLLEREYINDKKIKKCQICTSNLVYQISNILDLSQIVNNTFVLHPQINNFQECISEIEPSIRQMMDKTKEIRIEIQKSKAIPKNLTFDSDKLKQVIFNIASNAMHFTLKGVIFLKLKWRHRRDILGTESNLEDILSKSTRMKFTKDFEEDNLPKNSSITQAIKYRKINRDPVYKSIINRSVSEISIDQELHKSNSQISERNINTKRYSYLPNYPRKTPKLVEGYLQIEIVDTGIGIKSQKVNELNQDHPFNFSLKSGARGSGLGFWIAKEIIRKMGGGLRIESEEDLGCSVNIIIPVIVPTKEEISKSSLTRRVHALNNLRVLYVEDQIFNQKIIKELLRKDGITVSLADDGLQGYHKYIENPTAFDCILSDLRMPIMDGREMILKIRKFELEQGREFKIPIVVLTGDPSENEEKLSLEAGANMFINKPASRAVLLTTIWKAIHEK